jgi:hypothetical protein
VVVSAASAEANASCCGVALHCGLDAMLCHTSVVSSGHDQSCATNSDRQRRRRRSHLISSRYEPRNDERIMAISLERGSANASWSGREGAETSPRKEREY